MDTTTVLVDLAKHVFEIGEADGQGRVTARHRLNRRQFDRYLCRRAASEVVMEACGTAHYWGRVAQGYGHQVRLLPPAYVRPFVRRTKTDRNDVDGLLAAWRSGQLRPVPVKRVEQQTLVALHRVRAQWVGMRTEHINVLRGLLREHGVVLPQGASRVLRLVPAVLEEATPPLPLALRVVLTAVHEEARRLEGRIAAVEQQLEGLAAEDPVVRRLRTIPGIGLLTATALVGAVGHIQAFTRARRFASWLGLTPREHSSGLRRRLGRITKHGDAYLRTLLTHGARAVLVSAQRRQRAGGPLNRLQQWALQVRARCGQNKATIAVANKLARLVWAVWTRDTACTLPAAA